MEFEIGIDIVEHQRFSTKMNEKFLFRILSKKELEIFKSISGEKRRVEYAASRFATKEAYFKALIEGDKTLNYSDISVLNRENRSPYIECGKYDYETKVTISHSENYSIAQVIIIKKN